MFVHPHCPCSRATLAELTQVTGAAPDLAVQMLFVVPYGVDSGWARGELWDQAARVPGARVALDLDGVQARLFGAETSGHATLTAPNGAVVFSGGLTPSRGRAGEGLARRAVLSWVRGGTGASTAPVFGCELLTPGA
ncbi:RedB protein [Gemmata obscuriglobus]|uniref:RedB protein n=1 Tax=Gemmata obscuriglobus TaxID=114 RepID=A0A2Z3GQC4_9BACT|nr:RedB protein [Gemmata obscuriglobus]